MTAAVVVILGLVAAANLGSAWALRRERRLRLNADVCACGHHRCYHDPRQERCFGGLGGGCRCRQMILPGELPEMRALRGEQ